MKNDSHKKEQLIKLTMRPLGSVKGKISLLGYLLRGSGAVWLPAGCGLSFPGGRKVKKESEVSSASEYAEGVHRAHPLERERKEKYRNILFTTHWVSTVCVALFWVYHVLWVGQARFLLSQGSGDTQDVPLGTLKGRACEFFNRTFRLWNIPKKVL